MYVTDPKIKEFIEYCSKADKSYAEYLEKYDENIKNIIVDIMQNAKDFTKEKWESLLKTDDQDIIYEILVSPYAPEEIVYEAVQKCESPFDKAEATRNPLSKRILDEIAKDPMAIDRLRTTMLWRNKGYNEKSKLHQDNINYYAERTFRKKINDDFIFLSNTNDENKIEEFLKNPYSLLTEDKLTAILNNIYISDEFRNKIFEGTEYGIEDVGYVLENLKIFTKEMAEAIYASATETLDIIDAEKVGGFGTFYGAERQILHLYQSGALTEDMQLDYINRKINMQSHGKTMDDTIEQILRETKNPTILTTALQLKCKTKQTAYFNENMPTEILEKEFKKLIKKIQKMIDKDDGHLTKTESKKLLNWIGKVKISNDDFDILLKHFLPHSRTTLYRYSVESKMASKYMLEKIKSDINKNPRMSKHDNVDPICAFIRLELMEKWSKEEMQKAIYAIRGSMAYEKLPSEIRYGSARMVEAYIREYGEHTDELLTTFADAVKKLKIPDGEKIINDTKLAFKHHIDREERDKEFDVQKNTTYKLSNTLISLRADVRTTSMYHLYERIDDKAEKFQQIKEELQKRGKWEEFIEKEFSKEHQER